MNVRPFSTNGSSVRQSAPSVARMSALRSRTARSIAASESGISAGLFPASLHAVKNVDAPAFELTTLEQLQIDLPLHVREHRDARPQDERVNVQPDLVDEVGIEQGTRQF